MDKYLETIIKQWDEWDVRCPLCGEPTMFEDWQPREYGVGHTTGCIFAYCPNHGDLTFTDNNDVYDESDAFIGNWTCGWEYI